jgi:hypothetical protein
MIQMGLATVKEYCYVFLARTAQDNTTMKKAVKKSGRAIRPARSPVIAIRVPAPMHEAITKAAKDAEMTMSEYVAQLISRGQEWQDVIGDARKLLSQAKAEAKRIVDSALELHLRRQNWRPDGAGGWRPPEVHGLPPDGFNPEVTAENLFSPVAEPTPAKKRKTK